MFNSWKQVKKHFKEPDIFKMLDVIFKKKAIQDKAIEFNQEQLQQGKDVNDKVINTIGGSPYRPFTISIKQSKGQPTNIVTLEDTGDFYKTFRVVLVSGGYEIIANFQKDDGSILDNFQNDFDFLGVEDSFLIELVMEFIRPELSRMIKEQYKI